MGRLKKDGRLGKSFVNKRGEKATCVEYNNAKDIIVEMENGERFHTHWDCFSLGNFGSLNKQKERVGSVFENSRGEKGVCVKYGGASDVVVEMEDGSLIHTHWDSFRLGKFGSLKIDRTGEVGVNNDGQRMEIIKYNTARDIDVLFDDGYIAKNVHYTSFLNGKLRSPLHPTLYNIGYIGIGKYKTTQGDTIGNEAYRTWDGMLRRCYNKDNRVYAYKDCTVDEKWHNFQNFAEWYENNFYTVPNEQINLDKDILVKNNRVYSEDTCIFVPRTINMLFIKQRQFRGEYPIGVTKVSQSTFSASLNKEGKPITLGRYNTPEEAFYAYKKAKEEHIKYIADKYKQYIPEKLYNALYAYEVEITD